jgi:hypothetical protein
MVQDTKETVIGRVLAAMEMAGIEIAAIVNTDTMAMIVLPDY